MPTNNQPGALTALTNANPPAKVLAVAAQAAKHLGVTHTLQGWAQLAMQAGNVPGAAKVYGSPLRQYLARSTGNGAHANGQGRYPAYSGAQLLKALAQAAGVHSATHNAGGAANAAQHTKAAATAQAAAAKTRAAVWHGTPLAQGVPVLRVPVAQAVAAATAASVAQAATVKAAATAPAPATANGQA